jgi:hypothetical protein
MASRFQKKTSEIPAHKPVPRADFLPLSMRDITRGHARVHHPQHVADSPNTKETAWVGDYDDVPLPNWHTLLAEEVYDKEVKAAEQLKLRYTLSKDKQPAAPGEALQNSASHAVLPGAGSPTKGSPRQKSKVRR